MQVLVQQKPGQIKKYIYWNHEGMYYEWGLFQKYA